MIKQSFCFPLFRPDGMSLREVFSRAKAMGYPAVELWQRNLNGATFDEFLDAANHAGLTIASMCGHFDIKRGMNNRAEHARIEAEMRESIALAAQNGIRSLICFSGNRMDGQTDEDARAACVESLRRLAPDAEKAGVLLNMELLNSKVNHPGYLCDHTAWGADVVRRVASPSVKLLYDIYHMQIMEGDVIRTIRDNLDIIGHMHTAGNPGRWDFADANLPQELNYRGICRAISQTSYAGFVGHEFTPQGDRLEALRAAFELCDA
ncbi:MAG TPA: TIM barrel protein [Thermoflexales bacterium]|nr:TIM barrel protein [Thermoflexales bacterium]HQZ99001.1 TIM barrel protein [Thermoflexales bacterium]